MKIRGVKEGQEATGAIWHRDEHEANVLCKSFNKIKNKKKN